MSLTAMIIIATLAWCIHKAEGFRVVMKRILDPLTKNLNFKNKCIELLHFKIMNISLQFFL